MLIDVVVVRGALKMNIVGHDHFGAVVRGPALEKEAILGGR